MIYLEPIESQDKSLEKLTFPLLFIPFKQFKRNWKYVDRLQQCIYTIRKWKVCNFYLVYVLYVHYALVRKLAIMFYLNYYHPLSLFLSNIFTVQTTLLNMSFNIQYIEVLGFYESHFFMSLNHDTKDINLGGAWTHYQINFFSCFVCTRSSSTFTFWTHCLRK